MQDITERAFRWYVNVWGTCLENHKKDEGEARYGDLKRALKQLKAVYQRMEVMILLRDFTRQDSKIRRRKISQERSFGGGTIAKALIQDCCECARARPESNWLPCTPQGTGVVDALEPIYKMSCATEW
jgi:hypothetical protein